MSKYWLSPSDSFELNFFPPGLVKKTLVYLLPDPSAEANDKSKASSKDESTVLEVSPMQVIFSGIIHTKKIQINFGDIARISARYFRLLFPVISRHY